MIAVFLSSDLCVADRETVRILARAGRAAKAADAAEKLRLAAAVVDADAKVAAFLNGGPEMSADELRDAHRVLAAAVKAGVTSADRPL